MPATPVGVETFIDGEYFTHARSSLSPSTCDGYTKLWRTYRRHFIGVGFDMSVYEAQLLLRALYAAHPHLNKSTLRNVKNFFRGVWAHALRMGIANNIPWQHVQTPMTAEAPETHAYSPMEIEAMLAALRGSPHYLVVLLAACTGLRKSEIRGLRWSDWHPDTLTLSVNRNVWRGHIKTTKTRASKAPIPVVPLLAAQLREYGLGKSANRFIFENSKGRPMDLDNAAQRFIAPALRGKVQWRSWHPFRRGLATFLHVHGVDDKTIQCILRHSSVAVTQACYIKSVPELARKAMAKVTFGEEQDAADAA